MEKTISHLNSKAWYRFLKVIFILVLALSELTAVVGVYESNKPVEVSDYMITCNYGNQKVFFAQDEGIYLYSSDLSNGLSSLPDYQKEEISKDKCQISQQTLNAKLSAITSGTDDGKKLFDIVEASHTKGGYAEALGYALLAALAVVLFFEIVRRIFYYIILGKFNPPK